MKQTWLANTNQGYMVGDYFSASFANGTCFPVFSVAAAPSSTGVFNQAIDTWAGGLTITGGTRSGTGSRVHVRRLHSAATSTRRTANY